MTGQIPPYSRGYGFAKRREPYLRGWNHAVYFLKSNPEYRTRSESGSKAWHVYGPGGSELGVFKSLTKAMNAVLDIIYPGTRDA
jgi:hypothetical protein